MGFQDVIFLQRCKKGPYFWSKQRSCPSSFYKGVKRTPYFWTKQRSCPWKLWYLWMYCWNAACPITRYSSVMADDKEFPSCQREAVFIPIISQYCRNSSSGTSIPTAVEHQTGILVHLATVPTPIASLMTNSLAIHDCKHCIAWKFQQSNQFSPHCYSGEEARNNSICMSNLI